MRPGSRKLKKRDFDASYKPEERVKGVWRPLQKKHERVVQGSETREGSIQIGMEAANHDGEFDLRYHRPEYRKKYFSQDKRYSVEVASETAYPVTRHGKFSH